MGQKRETRTLWTSNMVIVGTQSVQQLEMGRGGDPKSALEDGHNAARVPTYEHIDICYRKFGAKRAVPVHCQCLGPSYARPGSICYPRCVRTRVVLDFCLLLLFTADS